MHFRRLGKTDLEVSEIGYGAWGIGQKQWIGATDGESLAAMEAAVHHGLNFIDTALAYGDGHSEKLVGKVRANHHSKVFVATKVPPKNRIWPAQAGTSLAEVFPNDYVKQCTEESLKNLDMPCLDLQQFHVWNPEWTSRDEWKRCIEDLKASGKVRSFGISINDHQPDSALEIVKTGLIDTVQVIYNIFDQAAATNLFPLCIKHNVGVIVRVPFDEGSLAGSVTADTVFPDGDFRANYFRGNRKVEVSEHVASILEDLQLERASLAQTALRFCISEPAVSTVIPGMRSVRNVDANCTASGLGRLPDKTLAILKHHAWDRNYYS